MKVVNFTENRNQVIEYVQDYFETDLTDQPSKTTSDAFEIVVVIDEIETLIDYKVFDPFRNCFSGYLSGTGWSNWQIGARQFMDGEYAESFDSAIKNSNYSL